MFSVFLEEIKQLTIFMIVGQTILQFGVSKRYEKYVKLILAFMIVAQLVFSIGSYLSSKASIWKPMSKEEYYERWEEYAGELEDKIKQQQSSMEVLIPEENEVSSDNREGDYENIIIERIWIN